MGVWCSFGDVSQAFLYFFGFSLFLLVFHAYVSFERVLLRLWSESFILCPPGQTKVNV